MDIKEFLKNYRKYEVRISMATACGKLNDNIQNIIDEKIMIDKVIEKLPAEQFMAIDCHYRKGMSYEIIARKYGYSKSTIYYRAKTGVDELQSIIE